MIQTYATCAGHDFTITGVKTWVSQGMLATHAIVIARMSDCKIGSFLVELQGDSFVRTDMCNQALPGLDNAEISFNEHPAILLEEAQSFFQLFAAQRLYVGRLCIATAAVAAVSSYVDGLVQFSRDRKTLHPSVDVEHTRSSTRLKVLLKHGHLIASQLQLQMGWVDPDLINKIAAFKIVAVSEALSVLISIKQLIGSTVFLYPHQLNDTSLVACKVAEGDNDVLKLVVLSH
jgi:alkylation response protein AidB-like acyl-CoA dehydrogenase